MRSILFLLLAIASANAYKFLGIFPIDAHSHFAIGNGILKALNEAGHEVTMISAVEPKKTLKNYKHIKVTDMMANAPPGT